ncbi:hypothetical protein THASP1DRAFT_22946 [Thamnocephalis sphaerospora]|uniref:RING-type domain-containing protein n=1 Tax=Thamnocephalis sphaerospora TaxID=78915 RepID=A0A4P9XSQ3_9FUNG|nr:hypothetical protein THASP1DRAFT_22946 [Thamnocephalis sphaerospora]|eukprot:RKP09178.1 hypothetical protein THASP1DRAFT_22946 [Thamnocephalis sphaerospora]
MATMQTASRFLLALSSFERLLKCGICGHLMSETHTVMECGHNFCHICAEERLGADCQCPTCGLPARVGNLRKNLSHDMLVMCAQRMRQLTGTQSVVQSAECADAEGIKERAAATPRKNMQQTSDTGPGLRGSEKRSRRANKPDREVKRRKSGLEDAATGVEPSVPDVANVSASVSTEAAQTACSTPGKVKDGGRGKPKSKRVVTPAKSAAKQDTLATPRVSLRRRKVDNYFSPANYSGYDDTCAGFVKEKSPRTAFHDSTANPGPTHKHGRKMCCGIGTGKGQTFSDALHIGGGAWQQPATSCKSTSDSQQTYITDTPSAQALAMNTPHTRTLARTLSTETSSTTPHILATGLKQSELVCDIIADAKGLAPRTVKYMSALLAGCWIVDFDWVVKSVEAGCWLDPAPFEVHGDSGVGVSDAVRRSRLREANRLPRLFAGLRVHLASKQHDSLRRLIALGGGVLTTGNDSTGDHVLTVLDKDPTSTRARSSQSDINDAWRITTEQFLRSISLQHPCWPESKCI